MFHYNKKKTNLRRIIHTHLGELQYTGGFAR